MVVRRGGNKLPMKDVCYYHWPVSGTDKFGLFGICDGHGGTGAATSVSKIMPQIVASILSDTFRRERVLSQCDASDVLREAFSQTEAIIYHHYEGCTATVLLVWADDHENFYAQCANVGDSACVVKTTNTSIIRTMSSNFLDLCLELSAKFHHTLRETKSAHTPYDPDKIQAADKLVILELKNLSELKHFYREHNPKPVCVSPQDSRLAAEIQEQQSLLKTYEVMVKKFQSEIQNKDSEIGQLQQQIQEASQKRVKLKKNLKLRGLSAKESENAVDENGLYIMDLTPELFRSAVEAAYRAIHDFSKPLINMMKAAGWDLDAAANSIEPDIAYAKRAHKKYAFESHMCQRMFTGFQDEFFSLKHENSAVTKDIFFHQYLALREMDPLDAVGQSPDSKLMQ